MKKIILLIVSVFLVTNYLNAQPVNGNGNLDFGISTVNVVTLVPTGGTTIYDLQSLGSAEQIVQTPSNIHGTYMCSPLNDTLFINLRSKYFISTNLGTNWSFISNVPSIRSGTPSITILSDGRELLASHSDPNGTGSASIRIYVDAFEGLGSFTTLDPGDISLRYPKIMATKSTTLPVKYIVVGTRGDSCFILSGTNLTSPGTFFALQYIHLNSPETYSIGRGSDGRLGIAFIASDSLAPTEKGNVYFIESTNNGNTFSYPLKIFAPIHLNGDTLIGSLKGVNIAYQGNSPKVVFETVVRTSNNVVQTKPAQIRFWSPVLPGPDPFKSIIIADSSNVPFAPNIGVNDNLAPLCRPVIGCSTDSALIYVAFMASSSQTGGNCIPTSFRNIYFTYSANSNQWAPPVKISTDSIPRKDWTYPSMSPTNDKSGTDYFANITVTADSIPGSFNNGRCNGQSLAKQMFIRVKVVPSFTNNAPAAPVLYHPSDYQLFQPRNPLFVWYPVYNATLYRLRVTTDSTFATSVFDTLITNTYFQTQQNFLSPNTIYYWKVIAINTYGSSGSPVRHLVADNVPHYSISGNVKYSDNNQIITSGYVKAIKLNRTNGAILTLDSCDVQPDGSYILPSVRQDSLIDISVYPNSTQPNDGFVPTYYPSTIMWESATAFNTSSNLTNINILAFRKSSNFDYSSIEGHVYRNMTPLTGLKDAIAYAKIGTTFYSYFITGSDGLYSLKYLVPGTYKIIINRLGYYSDSSTVTINTLQNINPLNFTLTSPFVGIANNQNIIPDSYALNQNYPNPFNPTTNIKFQIKDLGLVTLKVYDILGRELITLVNEKLKPGYYNVSLDGTRLSSGVYFYKLVAGDFVDTKKMMLIK